jgi:phosphomannomutase
MDLSELKAQAEAWRRADPDPETARELEALLVREDWAELSERFAGPLAFGTAGLRGLVGAGPNRMNRAVVRRTTAGLARYLKAQGPEVSARGVVVGRDARRMSRELAEDVAGVLAAEGVPALVLPGLAPTPLTAYAVLELGAAAGVMVTASHNPPEYNGYKVYWGDGAQIVPPHDAGIAAAIAQVEPADRVALSPQAAARAQDLWRDVPEALGESYLAALDGLRVHRAGSDSLRIVYTAMHGVGGAWMERALARAGFRHVYPVAEQHAPDGAFPTVRFPNPEEPGAMERAHALAEEVGAHLVLANDPDADRLAVTARERSGRLRQLSGNEVGLLLGHYLLTRTRGSGRPHVVSTIVSSVQLGEVARALGAVHDEVLTGFKWIYRRALERERAEGTRFVFGFEEALGYGVGTLVHDKDGLGAALLVADLAAWCESRGSTLLGYLEEIQREHGLYLGAQRNFTLPGAEGQAAIAAILESFRRAPPERIGALAVVATRDYRLGERRTGAQRVRLTLPSSDVIAYELEGGGRVTLRPSGTEPKIKYYFELREALGPGEPVDAARARGEARLATLVSEFLALAADRGQRG